MGRVILLNAAIWIGILSACEPADPALPAPPSGPEPTEPKLDAEVPVAVPKETPFVVQLCGVDFKVSVSILFDSKYPAGGLMGWDSKTKCKRQTITGLKNPGLRVLQFALDGELQQEKFEIRVLD